MLFGLSFDYIDMWRDRQKDQVVIAQQEIVEIVDEFFEIATTKLGQLQQYQATFDELIKKGDTASVLPILDRVLSFHMPDTLLTGKIQDYKDDEGMLVNEVLFKRINTSIEAC